MDQSRVSKSKIKRVRKQHYVKGKPIVGYGNRTRKSNFVAASYIALKNNKNVLWQTKSGYTLFSIKSMNFSGTGKHRKANINSVPIASWENNRSVNIQARPFLKPASLISYNKANVFFIKNARERFKTGKK